MAYCRFCGANVEDSTEICMKCGCRVKKNPTQFNQSKILRLMALVFMIITCIALVIVSFALWGIILLVDNYVSIIEIMFDPMSVSYSDSTIKTVGMIISALPLMVLIWAIPMTIHYFKCLKQNRRVSMVFKIFTLLLVNLVAGICMLCDNSEDKKTMQTEVMK